MMQNMFAAPQEQSGPRAVATVVVGDGVYEEVIGGAVSRATAVVAHDYPVSKYGGVKGDMYYWLERGKSQNKSKVRLMHCSKDPRRREEGQHYNDTTYSYVLVLVRICGGEKDGHIEMRKPYGQISAADLRSFIQKYGAALDQTQLDYLEAQVRRAEEASANGKWFWVSNG